MHYYKRNLGDYAKKAGKLSMLQHGAYTLLIDACYDREQFPTLDEAIDWTWASTTEEVEAVTFVLRKFFTLVDGVYVQQRIVEEIADYHAKSDTNKRIAIERETKRKEKSTKRERSVNEAPPNQEPRTNNQEPLTNKKPSAEYSSEFEEAWSAYPARSGASKKDSFKAWSARIKAGASADEMISGANRYAVYCESSGTEDRFIKQPSTFFGVGEHYKSDWTPVATKPSGNQTANDARLDVARQIFGGSNGTDRQVIDITPSRSNQGDGARIQKTGAGVRQPALVEMAGDEHG